MGHGHAHGGPPRPVAVAVLTVSDSRSETEDRSGALIRERLEEAGHRVHGHALVPDEPAAIRERLRRWIADRDAEAVIVTGGTGVSPRDRTPEAVADLLDRRLDGFGELFRMLSWEQVGSAALLSRALAGIAGDTPIFSLPGSTRAVALAMDELILPELGHLIGELRKGIS